MSLFELWRSGLVRRWHCNPDLAHTGQSNAAHQWGVAMIILAQHPNPSAALIRAALCHDVGEMVVGDLPYPFKKANPDFAARHRDFEDMARVNLVGAFDLTETDWRWLKYADAHEAILWMRQHRPELESRADWAEQVKQTRYELTLLEAEQ